MTLADHPYLDIHQGLLVLSFHKLVLYTCIDVAHGGGDMGLPSSDASGVNAAVSQVAFRLG